MRRLAVLLALALGACDGQVRSSDHLHIYPDTTRHVVCYQIDTPSGQFKNSWPLSCVYVPPAPPAEPDGTYHVPPNPGSAWQHDGHIDRV